MVENGKIEITDVSKPVQIPFIENTVNLKVLIMNCYLEDKNARLTVSAGPYIEKAKPNPATPQGQVTVEGISFGAAQNGTELSLGNETITEIVSWNNTKIVFNLPDEAESGKLKVTVNGIASNEIQLDVGEKEGPTFQFTQTWDVTHWPSGWYPELATITFTVNVNGRVLNGLNPIVTLKDFNVDDAKLVEVSNMKRSEVVTITGTVAETLSSHTISPMAPDCKFIYTYSNPKLVRYEGDVSVETYPDMNFSWVIPSEESEWYYKTGIYVEYDLEVQRYSQEDENAPFTHDKTTTFKSKVFHLVIEANKDVPEWDTP